MKEIFLAYSHERGVATNADYPFSACIHSLEELKQACSFDHVGAQYKNSHRANKNFIQADMVMMDLDNTHSEKPEDWITPDLLHEKLPEVPFYVIYSRHHMQEKEGKAPRPKFHVYMPLSEPITKYEHLRSMKEALRVVVPEFDIGAKDSARFFYGVANPDGTFYEGNMYIDEFLIINGIEPQPEQITFQDTEATASQPEQQTINEGMRDNSLFHIGIDAISKYSEKKARKIFDAASERCNPPLPVQQVNKIWQSVLKRHQAFKEKFTEKKQTLTLDCVEKTLQALNISVQYDVITKELKVSDLPTGTAFTPASYASMSAYEKPQANIDILPLFLSSYLKDKNYTFSDTFLTESINAIAFTHCYNPVLDMIQSTTYDGEDRLKKLYEVLGIRDNPFHCAFITKWLWQALALAFNDDGKAGLEFVISLQGAQGIGKTEFFRRLAVKPEWFREGAVIDMRNKDSIIESTSVWICELGEFDATAKKEQASLKSFLSSHHDTYRKPYGRNSKPIKRRTIFAATVNPEQVQRDASGSRRYAFIHVQDMDKQFILHDMTPDWCAQLWRQVYEKFYLVDRFGYHFSEAERKYSERSNEDFRVPLKGETELLDLLDWTSERELWQWYTALEIKIKYEKALMQCSANDIASALRAIYKRFGLDVDEYRKRSNGKTQFKLPNKEPLNL